ncbi:DinB family protein [Winogradskyella sp. SM1960]|uniref:DinB family protein n=1 Tax=Winogradskyella sp. SM1960 TaxID=2865955 RepID=UPI001CD1F719|nr:DinB family protein [Winogradskyella sp. SM1960]
MKHDTKKMTQSEFIILNFKEIRRRSIKLWNGLPEKYYNWKPDEKAMSASDMIRHVLEADYGWNLIINQGDMTNYKTPWENRPFINLTDELEFAEPYRKTFIERVRQFSDTELNETEIIHPGNGEKKILGTYLLRIGYHESVHAGQFLSYLRAMKIERPKIWD